MPRNNGRPEDFSRIWSELDTWQEGTRASGSLQSLVEESVRRTLGRHFLLNGPDSEPTEEETVEEAIRHLPSPPAELRAKFRSLVGEVVRTLFSSEGPKRITRLVWMWGVSRTGEGDDLRRAEEQLFAELQHELERRADSALRTWQFSNERRKLDPSELVHDLYILLKKANLMSLPENSAMFFGLVTKTMKNHLYDRVRKRTADKRPQSDFKHELKEDVAVASDSDLLYTILANDLLDTLEPALRSVVELRFYAGLTNLEIAAELGISDATVKRRCVEALGELRKRASAGPA